MKVGVLTFPTNPPVDVAVLARRAEELGYSSLWVGEHPIMPVEFRLPLPRLARWCNPRILQLVRRPLRCPRAGVRGDKQDEAGNGDLPDSGAQPSHPGQGDRHPGLLLRGPVHLRHRRGLESGGDGDYGGRLPTTDGAQTREAVEVMKEALDQG